MIETLAKSRKSSFIAPLTIAKLQYIIFRYKCPVGYGAFLHFSPDLGRYEQVEATLASAGNYLTEIVPIGR